MNLSPIARSAVTGLLWVLWVITWPFCALFRLIRRAWRATSYEGLKKAALLFFMALVVALVVGVVSILQLLGQSRERGIENQQIIRNSADTLEEVQKLVERVDDQTSPEAQARQQRQIDAILVRIKCDTQETIQEGIQQLVALGIEDAGAVRIVTAECAKPGSATTTTTAAGG